MPIGKKFPNRKNKRFLRFSDVNFSFVAKMYCTLCFISKRMYHFEATGEKETIASPARSTG